MEQNDILMSCIMYIVCFNTQLRNTMTIPKFSCHPLTINSNHPQLNMYLNVDELHSHGDKRYDKFSVNIKPLVKNISLETQKYRIHLSQFI